MKLIFSKNFDDFDDFKEIEVDEENISPYAIGKIISYEQQFNWELSINEYNIADRVFLLACKQEFLISSMQESIDKLQDDMQKLLNK